MNPAWWKKFLAQNRQLPTTCTALHNLLQVVLMVREHSSKTLINQWIDIGNNFLKMSESHIFKT